jgi:hypothetical protein
MKRNHWVDQLTGAISRQGGRPTLRRGALMNNSLCCGLVVAETAAEVSGSYREPASNEPPCRMNHSLGKAAVELLRQRLSGTPDS